MRRSRDADRVCAFITAILMPPKAAENSNKKEHMLLSSNCRLGLPPKWRQTCGLSRHTHGVCTAQITSGSSANSGSPVELRARETASGNAPRNKKTRQSKRRRRGPCILRGAGVVTNHWGGSLVPIREKEAMGEQRGLPVTRSTQWERTFCGEGNLHPRPA